MDRYIKKTKAMMKIALLKQKSISINAGDGSRTREHLRDRTLSPASCGSLLRKPHITLASTDFGYNSSQLQRQNKYPLHIWFPETIVQSGSLNHQYYRKNFSYPNNHLLLTYLPPSLSTYPWLRRKNG